MSLLSVQNTEFPREFAEFVAYVGPDEVHRAVSKVIRKLADFGNAERRLFGNRYFFQGELAAFTDGPRPFQLALHSLSAVRSAGFIASVNRARIGMSASEANHLRAMILDNLKPDRDFRQIEHEIRCYTHLRQKGYDVHFADLGADGAYDLLCRANSAVFEVECKTVSQDTGNPIKVELMAQLAKHFFSLVKKSITALEPGIFAIRFKSEARLSNEVRDALKKLVTDPSLPTGNCEHASVSFIPKPNWRGCTTRLSPEEVREMINSDPDVTERHFFTRSGENLVGGALAIDRPNELATRIVQILKSAADQLSGARAGVVWLHFVDLSERGFMELAQFAMGGRGRGLDALVANALARRGSTSIRDHVNAIVFSSEPDQIAQHPALDGQLLLAKAASVGGPMYVVRNAQPRFLLPDNVL